MDGKWWLVFVVGAVLSWGCYVPMLHEGQKLLGGTPKNGGLRAFLCVGLAYFVTAVLIPLVLLFTTNLEARSMSFSGSTYATIAGILGAAGALCIILSIKNGGNPLYVAPLVFAGAPIVNVLLSMAWHKTQTPQPMFFVGIALAAIGAGLVLIYKPETKKPVVHATPAVVETTGTTAPATTATPATSTSSAN